MLAKVFTAGLLGIDGRMVTVEVDESNGLPHSLVIGNVSLSVREALERCTVALKNSQIFLPPKRLTISLQPADFHKSGTGYDLPILVGILYTLHMVDATILENYAFLGEVGLDGRILHVRGVLPSCTAFQEAGLKGVFVSKVDRNEASVVDGLDVIGIENITELLSLVKSREVLENTPRVTDEVQTFTTRNVPDFSEVCGQEFAIRAALIAAAGRHNLLLSGSAGSGKSMIAKRLPSILPQISHEDDIEVSKVYSIAGLLPEKQALLGQHPFRSPHASITIPALVGGSNKGMVIPGEIALASKGILFLDELPLFSRAAIEALRQPMEDKCIVINRLNGTYSYPADCMIVAAMNPCPCGYAPSERCHCTPGQIRTYQRGISKPILERLDLCVEVAPVDFSETLSQKAGLSSSKLREMVVKARERQRQRFLSNSSISPTPKIHPSSSHQSKTSQPFLLNSEYSIREIRKFCVLGEKEQEFMRKIFHLKQLSMRTYHKILKVSRTIADLADSDEISVQHLSEAVSYRSLEDRLYGNSFSMR